MRGPATQPVTQPETVILIPHPPCPAPLSMPSPDPGSSPSTALPQPPQTKLPRLPGTCAVAFTLVSLHPLLMLPYFYPKLPSCGFCQNAAGILSHVLEGSRAKIMQWFPLAFRTRSLILYLALWPYVPCQPQLEQFQPCLALNTPALLLFFLPHHPLPQGLGTCWSLCWNVFYSLRCQ